MITIMIVDGSLNYYFFYVLIVAFRVNNTNKSLPIGTWWNTEDFVHTKPTKWDPGVGH